MYDYLNNYTRQLNILNGKMVDSVDVVRVSEVPFGSFGVFPKADLSSIYIKSWNNDGTTSITEYSKSNIVKDNDVLSSIFECLEEIKGKLDITSEKEVKEDELF